MSPETLLPQQPAAEQTGPGIAPGADNQAPTSDLQPGDSWTAYSPNVDEGLNFEQAYSRLGSQNQAAFKSIANDVLRTAGLQDYDLHDAVGDWSDGAENSVMQVIRNPPDPETSRYLAAWQGLLGNQKAVLNFTAGQEGPDSVYQIYIPDKPASELRKELDTYGIQFRTIVPKKDGHVVVVYDEGRSLRPNVSGFAEANNAVVREALGKGEFIGGHTRTAARAAYRDVIKRYETQRGKVRAGPKTPDATDHPSRPDQPRSLYQYRARPARRVRFAAGQAPEGGMAVRGVYYPGGKYIPDMPAPDPLDSGTASGYNAGSSPLAASLGPDKQPKPKAGSKPTAKGIIPPSQIKVVPPRDKTGVKQTLPTLEPEAEEHYAALSTQFADALSQPHSELTDDQIKDYTYAAHKVWLNMPTKALEIFRKGMQQYHVYGNVEDLSKDMIDMFPHQFGKVDLSKSTIGGVYWDGQLWIDGGRSKPSEFGMSRFPEWKGAPEHRGRPLGQESIPHIYAHEFTHVIDGPDYELSGTQEWHHAWEKEIKPGYLTKYATTNRIEGFAEFGRLLYTRHLKPDQVKRLFPRCSKYFESLGLWPNSPPQTRATSPP